MNDMNEKKKIILETIDEEDCVRICKTNLHHYKICKHLEWCY